MAKMRYFKCRFPKQKRYASNGQAINFIDVGGDIGVGKTDNDWLANEIHTMINEQRGGVFSIGEEEYESLKKNPSSSSPSPWREEVSRAGVEVNRRPLGQSLSTAPAGGVAATEVPAIVPLPDPPAKPKASKRQ